MTNPPGAMPPLPEPFGHIHDDNGNQPLSFDHGPVPWERSIGCSTQEVYSFDQLQAYAAPLIARVAELQAELARTERNRAMWKQQCFVQAQTLRELRETDESIRRIEASIDAAIAAKD